MIDETEATVRNIGLLTAQRGFLIVGNFLFAVLVPRLIGPENYGRLALITSLFVWFVLAGDLGFTQVMGRFVPQLKLCGDRKSIEKLFSSLLSVSLVSGSLSAGFYLLVTGLWLIDLNRLPLAAMAAAVFVRACAHPFFTLFVGLNQAARWGMEEVSRRWISIAFLLIGFYLGGLAGACIGLLGTELIVLAVGLQWGRSYFSRPEMRLDIGYLTPFFRFGFIFFIISLFQTTFQRSGEIMIRFFHTDYVQVAYFGLAYSIYLTLSAAIPQFTMAFVPLMTTLLAKGESKTLEQWIEHLLKWLAVGGTGMAFGVLLLGNNLVPLMLGAAYKPVAAHLMVLITTFLVQALGSVCSLLTIVHNRPKIALSAMIIRLLAFWSFGLPLVRWNGGRGASWAVLIASACHAGYFTWRMRKVISFSLRGWLWAIGLGSLFLPMLWLRLPWPLDVALYIMFMISYCSVLFFFRVITPGEITRVSWAFRKRYGLDTSRTFGQDGSI